MPSSYTIDTTFPPGSTPGTPAGPYLLPATGGQVDTTKPLVLYIGALAAANTSTASPGIATSEAQPAFTLTWTAAGFNASLYFAQVSIAASYVWSADAATRARMAQYFNVFRSQVEALEVTPATAAKGGLIPGGTPLLLNRVATNMPLRFDEILPYLYNFNPGNQTFDLVGGMMLRVEWAGYQYCDAPGGQGNALNSFVNSGTGLYPIAQRSDFTLALDTFLASLAPGYNLNPPPTCPTFAAGPLDWSVQGNARRRWRVILPSTIAGSGNVDNQGSSTSLSSLVLGADTFADLDAATADVLAGNSGCGKAAAGNNPIVSIAFNSRVAVIPLLPVMFNNQMIPTPLGSTVRNLIQQISDPAPYQFNGNNATTTNVGAKLRRWSQVTGIPVSSQSNAYSLANFAFMTAAQQTVPVGPLGDSYDAPLAKGDVLTTTAPPS
ncbi:MAG: hypothetical protein WDN01_02150 [Rhizomicrobium sp.]